MTEPIPTTYANKPSILCDMHAEIAKSETTSIGVLWRLSETGRQLDANLVQLAPGRRIELHTEPDLDVLIVIINGTGALSTDDRSMHLAAGLVAWLPRGSSRSLTAGHQGLIYFSVHRRRPGMQIGRRPSDPRAISPVE